MACQQVTMFEGFPEMVINIPLKIQKIVKFGDCFWKVSGGCLSQALFLPFLKIYFIFSTLTGPLDIQCVCNIPSPFRGTGFLPTSGSSLSMALTISSTEKLISSFSPHNISNRFGHIEVLNKHSNLHPRTPCRPFPSRIIQEACPAVMMALSGFSVCWILFSVLSGIWVIRYTAVSFIVRPCGCNGQMGIL